jgi:hypothetical protein
MAEARYTSPFHQPNRPARLEPMETETSPVVRFTVFSDFL